MITHVVDGIPNSEINLHVILEGSIVELVHIIGVLPDTALVVPAGADRETGVLHAVSVVDVSSSVVQAPSHDIAILIQVQDVVLIIVLGSLDIVSVHNGLGSIGIISIVEVVSVLISLAVHSSLAVLQDGIPNSGGRNLGTSAETGHGRSDHGVVQLVGHAGEGHSTSSGIHGDAGVVAADPVQDDVANLEAIVGVVKSVGSAVSRSAQTEGALQVADRGNKADVGVLDGDNNLMPNIINIDIGLHTLASQAIQASHPTGGSVSRQISMVPVSANSTINIDSHMIIMEAINLFLKDILEVNGYRGSEVRSDGVGALPNASALRIVKRPHGLRVAVAVQASADGQAAVVGPDGDVADDHIAKQDVGIVALLSIVQGDVSTDFQPVVANGQNPDIVGDSDDVVGQGADHHGSLQSIQHHLSSFLTGDGLSDVVISSKAVQQANSLGIAHDTGLPVGANVALSSGVEADQAEQHLGSLDAGHVAAGIEGGSVAASNNAGLVAVSNVASGPTVLGVGKLAGAGIQRADVVAGVGQNGHHLGHLLTGDGVGGLERAIGITIEDTDSGQDIDGFLIADLIIVSVVADLPGADHGSEAKQSSNDQDQSQNFAKVLHESSSF